MDIIGKSPIPAPFLFTGKCALVICALFPAAGWIGISPSFDASVSTHIAGFLLYGGGIAIMIVSIIQLGRSIAVGLPSRPTELRSGGLYRFSRNPIYTGAFVMCAGSCLMAVHIVNILSFAAAFMIHSWIIRREEVFLSERFGKAWDEYKSRVPRYFGCVVKDRVF
jgi:protein-S-isoprenylcysteine O-methyltransferase Ste14